MNVKPAFTMPFYYLAYAAIGTGVVILIAILSIYFIKSPAKSAPLKVAESPLIWVRKDTSVCNEEWQLKNLNPEIYFRSIGVEVSDTIVRLTGSKRCEQCSCLSGETLYMQIREDSLPEITGFVRTEKPK